MSEGDASYGVVGPIRNELSGEVAANAIQAGYIRQLSVGGSGYPVPTKVLRQLPPAPRFFVGREGDVRTMWMPSAVDQLSALFRAKTADLRVVVVATGV